MGDPRPSVRPVECVAFVLIDGGQLLAEQRSPTKRVVPCALAIPGGHMEPGETPEQAVRRELEEELGVRADTVVYVCTLLHRSQEFRKLHYFAVEGWRGRIVPQEADGLRWVGFGDVADLDLDVDRFALSEYLRVYRPRPGR